MLLPQGCWSWDCGGSPEDCGEIERKVDAFVQRAINSSTWNEQFDAEKTLFLH